MTSPLKVLRVPNGKLADCLRCDFLPECYMASTEIRDRRRTLRHRHLLVRQMVQMKNRISGLLMETGVGHNKRRLHKGGVFPGIDFEQRGDVEISVNAVRSSAKSMRSTRD